MDDQIIAIYLLKALDYSEDPKGSMSDEEVMPTAIVAALYFRGAWEQVRVLLGCNYYIPTMLGKSRFNRRLHAISEVCHTVFQVLGEIFKKLNTDSVYVIDSFSIAACNNIRIPRVRLYRGDADRGYIASKRRYFYGLRIHAIVTAAGEPAEVFLATDAEADVWALHRFQLNLPTVSTLYADKTFNHYLVEDLMQQAGINLQKP